jgi:sirohydrochlorin ferrochelatase
MAKLIDVLEHEALMHYRDKVGVLLRQAASEIRALQNRLRRKASGKKQSLALTNAEREAISAAACICEDAGRTDIAVIINTALSRLG